MIAMLWLGDYVLAPALALLSPLPPALTANSFAASHSSLLTLGHKEPFPFDRAQDAILCDTLAKALEQALRRFAIADHDPSHPQSPPSVISSLPSFRPSKKPGPPRFILASGGPGFWNQFLVCRASGSTLHLVAALSLDLLVIEITTVNCKEMRCTRTAHTCTIARQIIPQWERFGNLRLRLKLW